MVTTKTFFKLLSVHILFGQGLKPTIPSVNKSNQTFRYWLPDI